MIPRPVIARWRAYAPWPNYSQIEQDLLISRILIDIFSDEFLSSNLAFRGGTALYKLFLTPAPRYSEDIDLVQLNPGPIKPIMERLSEVISYFEENRKTENKGHGMRVFYRFTSEYDSIPMKIKIEINGKEHFYVHELENIQFSINNEWFSGLANIKTFNINELLGTKLRALFQRTKGRDLFDLDYARKNIELDISEIVNCFKKYISFSTKKKHPSKNEFHQNLIKKMEDPGFVGDLNGILRPEIKYNQHEAFLWMESEVLPYI